MLLNSEGFICDDMQKRKTKVKVCSRGHKFYKSSDCPVCPVCWKGYYRKRKQSNFPKKLSAPALRALNNAKIYNLKQLTAYTQQELLQLHGMGPKGVRELKKALRAVDLKFAKN